MDNEKRFFKIKLSIFIFLSCLGLCDMNYGEGIIACNKIEHIYKKYSMDENMTPVYSVYADVGIGYDVLLYQCNTDVEYRKFMENLHKEKMKFYLFNK